MLSKLVEIHPMKQYRLQVRYEDGISGIVDISKYAAYFKKGRDFDTVQIIDNNPYRDEDFDMSADSMYIKLTGENPFILDK